MSACRKQSSPAVRAGIYTRISADPSGQRAGVGRQQADCEAHCQARRWEVVEVFCDNDASAYGRKPRRAYERMLAAVESGSIDAIVTWHNDRLHRSHKHDLRAAAKCGLKTAFIKRPHEYGRNKNPDLASEPEFTYNAEDFVDLAQQLGA